MVLTLGSPPEKGGEGKKKKNPGINPRQPVEKGRKKKNHVRLSVEVLKPDGQNLEFQDLDGQDFKFQDLDGRMDKAINI